MSDIPNKPYAQDKAGTQTGNPDVADLEQAKLHEQRHGALAVQLPERLVRVRDRLVEAFGELQVLGFRGELTVLAEPGQIIDLLTFCRDDPHLRCQLLADLSAVHWPEGKRVWSPQETTGWPSYEFGDEQGRIEVDYILYSLTHKHRFRLRVNLPDTDPHLPSAVEVYASANFMEREVYDFFGVTFDGHPNHTRILLPEDWEGHPLRKDYPLGGVEVQYKGTTIPPPDERSY